MKMNFKLLIFISCIIAIGSSYKSYESYKVYEVSPSNDDQMLKLIGLRKEGYDFWTGHFKKGDNVRVMVSPEKEKIFVQHLKDAGFSFYVVIENLQETINAQLRVASTRSSRLGSHSWDQYYNITEIYSWLDELKEMYPNIVETVSMGRSHDGHELKGVIIDFNTTKPGDTPLIGMIEGGIHAREWISPATVTWIIKEFLTSKDANVRFMAENIVWHIFPVVNPDGYSHTFTTDRLWRKNRNPANHVPCGADLDLGNGVDLNRNFDYNWMTIGAWNNPCAQSYAGPNATSELETQAIKSYVQKLNSVGNMIYYIAFHSYSQMILIPYSDVSGPDVLTVPNYADMYEIAIRGSLKLEARHGTKYTVGTAADILYPVSGSSFDWVKTVGVPIVLLFELRDLGRYGFLLPPDQIIPNNEEVIDCLVEMEKTTRMLGYYSDANVISYSIALSLTTLILLKLI